VEHGRFPSEWLSLSFAERATIAEFLEAKIKEDKKQQAKVKRSRRR